MTDLDMFAAQVAKTARREQRRVKAVAAHRAAIRLWPMVAQLAGGAAGGVAVFISPLPAWAALLLVGVAVVAMGMLREGGRI